MIQKLKQGQDVAARVLTDTTVQCHITLILQDLHYMHCMSLGASTDVKMTRVFFSHHPAQALKSGESCLCSYQQGWPIAREPGVGPSLWWCPCYSTLSPWRLQHEWASNEWWSFTVFPKLLEATFSVCFFLSVSNLLCILYRLQLVYWFQLYFKFCFVIRAFKCSDNTAAVVPC